MTRKTVRGIIRRKITDWLNHITDKELQKEVAENVIVTGGCIPSLLLDAPVGDYDVYIKSREVLEKLMRYYVMLFKDNPSKDCMKSFIRFYTNGPYPRIVIQSAGVASEEKKEECYEYFETRPDNDNEAMQDYVDDVTAELRPEIQDAVDMGYPNSSPDYVNLVTSVVNSTTAPKQVGAGAAEKNKYRPVFLSGNAITLSDKIQIITRFFGSPEEVHKSFDFVHCTCWYDHAANQLHLPVDAVVSILTKELRYIGSLYPICSIIRLRKFFKRGWTCNAGQIIKMVDQVNQLDLNSLDTWEDQLIGVDTAYFHEIISILLSDQAAGKTIDHSYVIELIDKMF